MKRPVIVTCFAAILLSFTGCSTILSGRTQTVTLATNPPGAACEVSRQGRVIGQVNPTPGGLMVDRTKHDLQVLCKRSGYQDATEYLESGTEGATFGNILAGGLIGWGVDSATGADNKYPEVKTISMAPLGAPPPPVNESVRTEQKPRETSDIDR